MIRKIDNLTAITESGAQIQWKGRFLIRYTDIKNIDVEVEPISIGGEYGVTIKENSFDKWSDGTSLSEKQKLQAKENFVLLLNFQELKLF
jgi:hypothetical protein